MANREDAPAEQIVIIRRKSGGDDDSHHGGVWKIAYADFMTAMMAFFLVMWLINAANTDTKAKVASYFNPIKLMDNSAQKKGLQDIDDKSKPVEGAVIGSGGVSAQAKPAPANGAVDHSYQNRKAQVEGKSAWSTRPDARSIELRAADHQGRAFRDPFNPLAPSSMRSIGETNADEAVEAARSTSKDKGGWVLPPVATSSPAAVSAQPGTSAFASGVGVSPNGAGATDTIDPSIVRNAAAADRVLRDVQAAAKQIGLTGGPAIDVTVEPDGVVLSLTDTSTFGMFGIGSADANIALVALLQSIAPVLTANSRRIIVRGHTDSRPFKTEKNNNWKLSMARAEAAAGILARSGIDESRIERIEAHADRKLKLEKAPEAAANRRIEILLRPVSAP